MKVPFRRDTFSISRCEIVAEMITLDDASERAMAETLKKGVVLHSCSYLKGPTFSFAAGSSPSGSY